MIHKMISMLLVVAMLLSSSVAATAVNVSISDVINLSVMNEVSVTQAVRSYFEARANYLLGNSTAMDWPVVGIANDEAVHIAQYIAKGISLQYTGYTVERMDCYDTHAEVDVVETITYIKEGVSATEEISHKLTLIPNDAGLPAVVADGYVEMCSNFESCSYLAPNTRSIMTTSVEDTSCCIVEIARAEIGTVETGTDVTKYGEWYGRNGVAWCVIFVSWCANQANVATSVIPKKAGSDSMLAWFDARDSYYRSNAYGGSYTPQPGDIIFIGDKIDDPYHVGLVEKIVDGKVWIIDGNWGDKVSNHAYRLTSSMIVGYGNPSYESTGHMFSDYTSNTENHWQ